MHERLRAVWDEPRPPHPPSRVWRDWALVAVLVPAALLEGFLRPDVPARAIAVILTVGLVPTLLWRRTHPLLMVAIAFGACGVAPFLAGGDQPGLNAMAYVALLPYALFRWGSGREWVGGAAIMLAKLVVSALLGHLTLGETAAGVIVLFAASALGAAVRYRTVLRSRELDQVKLLERERLARDLHDTVAHHVSAIAIRAQAGIAQPDAALPTLRLIEAEATRALAEMRAMVRVLRRDEPADRTPAPRIADLARLASRSGLPVDVAILGDVDDVPPPVGAAIYRLAQESVTNARRHARHATRIEVLVAADDTSVHLRVSDDGDASAVRPAALAGYGLVGMSERTDLLGGTFEAGPNPDRGWTVTATLPRTGAAT
ncbi:sensor histidine kinase [Phytohabitans rumicis]|uniref:histidine kinase n=1 Tax=Phytohabitans rumicis TaxID=1076125 RepID=A0A6V8LAK8_9ACTN|nr:histidine kinase [Phytohabitans rumicis]GFJ94243.1 two-component sensor histidine kinase [Phytohabitans rumicis]